MVLRIKNSGDGQQSIRIHADEDQPPKKWKIVGVIGSLILIGCTCIVGLVCLAAVFRTASKVLEWIFI